MGLASGATGQKPGKLGTGPSHTLGARRLLAEGGTRYHWGRPQGKAQEQRLASEAAWSEKPPPQPEGSPLDPLPGLRPVSGGEGLIRPHEICEEPFYRCLGLAPRVPTATLASYLFLLCSPWPRLWTWEPQPSD